MAPRVGRETSHNSGVLISVLAPVGNHRSVLLSGGICEMCEHNTKYTLCVCIRACVRACVCTVCTCMHILWTPIEYGLHPGQNSMMWVNIL